MVKRFFYNLMRLGAQSAGNFLALSLIFSVTSPTFGSQPLPPSVQFFYDTRNQVVDLLNRARFPSNLLVKGGKPTPEEFGVAVEKIQRQKVILESTIHSLHKLISNEDIRQDKSLAVMAADPDNKITAMLPIYFQTQVEFAIAAKIIFGQALPGPMLLSQLEMFALRVPRKVAEYMREINFTVTPPNMDPVSARAWAENSKIFGMGTEKAIAYADYIDEKTKAELTRIGLSTDGMRQIDRLALLKLDHLNLPEVEAEKVFLKFLKFEVIQQLSLQAAELAIHLGESTTLPKLPTKLSDDYLSLSSPEDPIAARKSQDEMYFRMRLAAILSSTLKDTLAKETLSLGIKGVMRFNGLLMDSGSLTLEQIFHSTLKENEKFLPEWRELLKQALNRAKAERSSYVEDSLNSYGKELIKAAKYAKAIEDYIHPETPIVWASKPVIVNPSQYTVPSEPTQPIEIATALTEYMEMIKRKKSAHYAEFDRLVRATLEEAEDEGAVNYATFGYAWKKELAEALGVKFYDAEFGSWNEEEVRALAIKNQKPVAAKTEVPKEGKFQFPEALKEPGKTEAATQENPRVSAIVEFYRFGRIFGFDRISEEEVLEVFTHTELAELGVKGGAVKTNPPPLKQIFPQYADRRHYYEQVLKTVLYQNHPILTETINGKSGLEYLVGLDDADAASARKVVVEYAKIAWSRVTKMIEEIAEAQSAESLVFKTNIQLLLTVGQSYEIFEEPVTRLLRRFNAESPLDRVIHKYVHMPMLASMLPVLYKLGKKFIFKRALFGLDVFFVNPWMNRFVNLATTLMLPFMAYDYNKWQEAEVTYQRQQDWFYSALRVTNGMTYELLSDANWGIVMHRVLFGVNAVLNCLLVIEVPGAIKAIKSQVDHIAPRFAAFAARNESSVTVLAFQKQQQHLRELNEALVRMGMSKGAVKQVDKVYHLWKRMAKNGKISAAQMQRIEKAYAFLKAYKLRIRALQASGGRVP